MSFIHHFQPYPLYTVLILSICYFVVQIILSNLTHALTLQMALNHMLCNILALAGSIISIKRKELSNEDELQNSSPTLKVTTPLDDKKNKHLMPFEKNPAILDPVTVKKIAARELKTRNTFGWARIEVLTMLIVCITLASLSFSLLVEALQTLVHIEHEDSMHLPIHVMILGFVGLLLHGFTYFVIGGYTSPQGSFLHNKPNDGRVIVEPSKDTQGFVEKALAEKQSSNNDYRLKEDLKSELGQVYYRTRREGSSELLRDVSTTVFFIVCAVIVHFSADKEHTAKFIDPVLSIFSCIMVVALSYPYMKEACLILLQTIPGHIDMENFESTLKSKFPEVDSLHDLHIWQLTPHTYIATVHIIFKSPKLYGIAIDNVRSHFHEYRIAHVTIQPEFHNGESMRANATASKECLMQCTHAECIDKVCCTESITDLREITVCPGGEHNENTSHGNSKEHSHGHGHSHSHSLDKYDHKHSHKHTKVVSKEQLEVPTAKEETYKVITEPSKIEIIKKVEQIEKETTESSLTLKTLESNVIETKETSEEPSINAKPKEETETADLSQTEVKELLKTALPSTETVDQSTSDNTKC